MYLPPETELWLIEQRRKELQEHARLSHLAAAARARRRRESRSARVATIVSLARRLRTPFLRPL
jgi:hypothetical protein